MVLISTRQKLTKISLYKYFGAKSSKRVRPGLRYKQVPSRAKPPPKILQDGNDRIPNPQKNHRLATKMGSCTHSYDTGKERIEIPIDPRDRTARKSGHLGKGLYSN